MLLVCSTFSRVMTKSVCNGYPPYLSQESHYRTAEKYSRVCVTRTTNSTDHVLPPTPPPITHKFRVTTRVSDTHRESNIEYPQN